MVKSLFVGIPILISIAFANKQAVKPGIGNEKSALIDQQQSPGSAPPGFHLPSFGVQVSWKADGSGKKKENERDDHEKPQIPSAVALTRTDTKPQLTTSTTLPHTTSKPTSSTDAEAAKKKKEQQEKEQQEKKKREEELKKKKEQEEQSKRKKDQEEQARKKKEHEEQARKKKEQEEQAKKKQEQDKNQGNNLPKKKRNPVPIKYQVPTNSGIAGVGGGSLPDPGFVLEPGDLFQKAVASAESSVFTPNTTMLLSLQIILVLFTLMLV